MKIIVAGFPKTGTKSMYALLRQLGHNVYDYTENLEYLYDDWIKIMTYGGTTDDFKRMYSNVDAVTDLPACLYWDEIHKAFPDSKIILTTRENEDVWFNSLKRQIILNDSWKLRILCIAPLYWKFRHLSILIWQHSFGYFKDPGLFGKSTINEMALKMKYRRHCANVIMNAPKDKLLVYNVKEGWEPLCKFLEIDIPSTPFPHRNVRGSIIDEFMKTNPVFLRMKREFTISASLIFILLAYGGYRLVHSKPTFLESWFTFLSPFSK